MTAEERNMITLIRMTEEEFCVFRESSIADYADDLTTGQNVSRLQAVKEAEEAFDGGLPNGLETENSFIMNIEDSNGKNVGWIWFEYDTKDNGTQQVFLCDLLIFESERRKGFASASIDAMNALAKKDGCSSSVLFVWDHNPGGIALYEKNGYMLSERGGGGSFMLKEL